MNTTETKEQLHQAIPTLKETCIRRVLNDYGIPEGGFASSKPVKSILIHDTIADIHFEGVIKYKGVLHNVRFIVKAFVTRVDGLIPISVSLTAGAVNAAFDPDRILPSYMYYFQKDGRLVQGLV
jgi:hypothetical protein